MKKAGYQALHNHIAARTGYVKIVTAGTRFLPLLIYLFYPAFLLYLILCAKNLLLYGVLVPLTGFLICTVWRKYLNAPRPYEVMEIPAIVPKDTAGKSFPSRHAASAAVIAVTVLPVIPIAGAVLLLLSILIALIRVLAGVHFIWDVVCGWLLGALTGILGILIFL